MLLVVSLVVDRLNYIIKLLLCLKYIRKYLSIYLQYLSCACATLQQTSLTAAPHREAWQLSWPITCLEMWLRNDNMASGTNQGTWGGSWKPIWCVRERVRPRVRSTSTGDGHVSTNAGHWLVIVIRGRANGSGVRLPMWHNYNNFEPMVWEVFDIIKYQSFLKSNIISTSCIDCHWNTGCVSVYNGECGRLEGIISLRIWQEIRYAPF